MNVNKKIGNDFEKEFCNILAEHGFWAYNLPSKQAGQPADVIAVKNYSAYLIDCKVCQTDYFSLTRIEPNQRTSMELFKSCGNLGGLFAIKYPQGIKILKYSNLKALGNQSVYLPISGLTLEEWLSNHDI